VQNFIGVDAFKNPDEYKRSSMLAQSVPKKGSHDDDEEDAEAINVKYEHGLLSMPITVSFKEMTIVLGRGIAWYFRLILYLILVNAILCVIALISIIPQIKDTLALPSSARPSFPSLFYLSSYDSGNYKAWQAASVLSMIFIFFIGPVYAFIVRRDAQKRLRGDPDAVEDPFEGQYGMDSNSGEAIDAIKYEVEPLFAQQMVRRFISLTVFVLVLGVQGVVTYYLQTVLNNTNSSYAALALAGVMSAINLFWKFVCQYLTVFELHKFWQTFRRWEVVKVFVFKILNVLVLYLVKLINIIDTSNECPLYDMAEQFLLLLLLDIAVSVVGDVVAPLAWNACCAKSGQRTHVADDTYRPEWDLADEYVTLMYR